ncbi:MAG: transglutaminase domain-containing protein [Armatimonadetes bacterium]|nr:transglutaminase domain-containing protein [Armatimonadota bacterium]
MNRVWLAVMALAGVYALYDTSAYPPVLVGAAVALTVGAAMGDRYAIPLAAVAGFALVLMIAVWTSELSAPRGHGFLFLQGVAYRMGLATVALLALLLLRKAREGEEFLPVAGSVALLMIAGNTQQSFPFGWCVLVFAVALVAYLRRTSSWVAVRPAHFLAAGLMLLVGGSIALTLGRNETWLMKFFQPPGGSPNFGSEVSISPRNFDGSNSNSVVLRVFSKTPPLYMAARRYVDYRNGTWISPEDGDPVQPVDSTYPLRQARPSTGFNRVELTVSRPEALPVPANAVLIAARLQELRVNRCGDAIVKPGPRFTGSYQVGLGPYREGADEELLDRCRRIEASPLVRETARKLVEGSADEAEALERLVSYFHENFTYGFEYSFGKKQDPIGRFLQEKPPAHCEVFATSLVVMLRSLGIPARYVNGFLVKERNEIGEYWIVRDRDAHAWVEIWAGELGWITVDPTPPSALMPPERSSLVDLLDVAARWLGRTMAFLWRQPAVVLQDIGLWLARHPWLALPLLCLTAAWYLRRRGRRAPSSRPPVPEDPAVARLSGLLSRFEALHGERPRTLTPLEWSKRMDQDPPRRFLSDYSAARYSQARRTGQDLEGLEELVARMEAERPG